MYSCTVIKKEVTRFVGFCSFWLFLPQSKQSLQNELNDVGFIVGRLKHIRIHKIVSETCMLKNKSNVLHQNNRMDVNYNFMCATQAPIVNYEFWCHIDEISHYTGNRQRRIQNI